MKMRRQFSLLTLKNVIATTLFSIATYAAHAATPLPPELVGVWAKTGAEFAGDALMKGTAVYLDADGVGASIAGDGTNVEGDQLTVTGYDASTHIVNVDYVENGKVVKSGSFSYNPGKKLLVSTKDAREVYERWFKSVSSETKQSFGTLRVPDNHP
jgi:hypothetical protein